MTETDERTNPWNKIESNLYQIKILLLVLIAVCVLGVYGISRAMWDDVAVSVTRVCEAIMGIGLLMAPVPLIFWVRAIHSLSRTRADTSAEVYWGNAIEDGEQYGGWFIGRFITDGVRQSTATEVKFSTHEEPYCEKGSTANQTATSLAINISGACEFRFQRPPEDGWTPVALTERGQYVIWEPGVLHSLRIEERCEMVVVRWPSAGRSDKTPGPDPWEDD